MKYDFNNSPSRLGTNCYKWDMQGKGLKYPLGVADSDWPAPDCIVNALKKRVENGAYGYTGPSDKYFENVIWWQKERNGWDIQRDWIVPIAGIVPAVAFSVLAYTEPGDKVIVQAPVYNPFFSDIEENDRKIAFNYLLEEDGYYTMDYDDLEKQFKEGAKLLILCSPHNPVGRVWTEEELRKLMDIVKKYNGIVVSDEIHADLILNGNKFFTAGFFTDMFDHLVVCTAPSKTFNIAGIQDSNIIIPNEGLRKAFQAEISKIHMGLNLFGYAAGEAAYCPEGAEWVDAQNDHLTKQYEMARDYFAANIPDWKFTKQEGTYLLWVDCSSTGLEGTALFEAFKEFDMFINNGDIYGGLAYGGTDKYKSFVRINTACSADTLKGALENMKALAAKYKK